MSATLEGSALHPIMAMLEPVLTGGLADYRSAYTIRPDDRAFVSGRDFIADELELRLESLAASYAQPERRAVATMWSKHHFARLIIPALAADLLLRRSLPTRLADQSIVSDAEGRTVAFLVPATSAPALGCGLDRFDALVEGHLRPIVEATARLARLSPRVLWNNAGNLLETVVRRLETVPGVDTDGIMAATSLLRERRRPDGSLNPLFEPVRYLGDPPQRVRKVCCLRYLIPSLKLCGTCPLDRDAA